MTELRLFGSGLLLCAGVIGALSCIKKERAPLATLDAWISLLSYVRGQIDLYLTPIPQILFTADPKLIQALHCKGTPKEMFELFNASQSRLSEEGRRILTTYLREMGSAYREEELKRCDVCIASLTEERKKLAEALPNRLKLGITLRICASLGIAILLW